MQNRPFMKLEAGSAALDETTELGGDATTELDRRAVGIPEGGALPFKPPSRPGAPAPAFGLTRMVPGAEERRPPEAPPRSELGDLFRKAFGTQHPKPSLVEAPAPFIERPLPPPALPAPPAVVPSPASVRAASDAAVVAERRATAEASGPIAIERSPTIERRSVVDLLAFDPSVPTRLRRSKTHAPIVATVAPPRSPQQVDALAGDQAPEERGRIDVLRVLSCGTPLGATELHASVDALLDDPHDFEIPLLLVEGEVRPTMDEVETLRVAAELAKSLGASSRRVQGMAALATDLLSRSVPALPEAAAALYKQLESATNELSLPSRHFADLVERTLLEARSFKKRTLLGAPRIRTELTLGRHVLPLYLPEAAASQLPLLPLFSLAALVEFRPREDAAEPNAAALVAFAFGRVLRAKK